MGVVRLLECCVCDVRVCGTCSVCVCSACVLCVVGFSVTLGNILK